MEGGRAAAVRRGPAARRAARLFRAGAAEGWGYHAFAWSARAPLTIGEHLNAVLSVDSSASGAAAVGGSFALALVSAPQPLPEPQLELSRWGIFYQGTGDPLTCRTDLRCGSLALPGQTVPVSVPGALEERLSAQVTWTPPVSSGFVAWRLRWQPEPAAAGGTAAEDGWYYWGFVRDPVALGRVNFPDRNELHSASLVIEDLRSGETKSAQACAEPGPPELFQTDTRLILCNEPPSAELTRAWCNLKGGSPPQCASLPPEENAPGTEVVTEDGTDEASGCQLSGASSGQALAGAAIAAIALYTARRRRKRT